MKHRPTKKGMVRQYNQKDKKATEEKTGQEPRRIKLKKKKKKKKIRSLIKIILNNSVYLIIKLISQFLFLLLLLIALCRVFMHCALRVILVNFRINVLAIQPGNVCDFL